MVKYRHYPLHNGSILTIASKLIDDITATSLKAPVNIQEHERNNLIFCIGYSIFNPNDNRYIRKVGNELALERLENSPIFIDMRNVVQIRGVQFNFISLRIMEVIVASDGIYGYHFTESMKENLSQLVEKLYDRFEKSFNKYMDESPVYVCYKM